MHTARGKGYYLSMDPNTVPGIAPSSSGSSSSNREELEQKGQIQTESAILTRIRSPRAENISLFSVDTDDDDSIFPENVALSTSSIGQTDPEDTPLHHATFQFSTKAETGNASLAKDVQTILQILSEHPEYAQKTNSIGELPLHYACCATQTSVSYEKIVNKLLEVFPDGAKYATYSERNLPLHYVCFVGAPSLPIVKSLLYLFPEAVNVQSEFVVLNGHQPLSTDTNIEDMNDACCNCNAWGVLFDGGSWRKTKTSFSSSSRKQRFNANYDPYFDENTDCEVGWSPLHLAVINEASVDVIREITKASSKCINLRTSLGRTALDCANLLLEKMSKQNETTSDDEDDISWKARKHNVSEIVVLLQRLHRYEKKGVKQRSNSIEDSI